MIPQIQPWIDEAELNELKRVIDSTYVTEHALTKEFEEMTKELTGAKYAIAVSNGTLGLFTALKALGIGNGDEVIVPDFTFIASANAIILAGAQPVFCDVDSNTFCLDPTLIEKSITKNTKAIMPVHIYGQSADMEAITKIAKQYNLYVIEDAAQGVGVKFNGRHTGTFGEIGVLSYYGNKTITCGEGGVILTDDSELAKECYRLKNHGRDSKGLFIHDSIGYNFSFTEMQAAIGISQMKKLSRIIEKKYYIYKRYISELGNIDNFKPVYIDERCQPVFWFTSFLSDDTNKLATFLSESGIQTRRFFYPLHKQPCYKDIITLDKEFPVSERIYEKGVSLPSSYNLSGEDQSYIIAKIREFYS